MFNLGHAELVSASHKVVKYDLERSL